MTLHRRDASRRTLRTNPQEQASPFAAKLRGIKATMTWIYCALLTIALGFANHLADAATLTVTNNADAGAGSLRAQLGAAIAGDTIVFATTGTIVLASPIPITNAVVVAGPGANVLAISGNNVTRIFDVSSTATIAGLTLQNGSANSAALVGGAIRNTGVLTLDGVVLKNNSAFDGGGAIYNASQSPTTGQLRISNSQLSANAVSDASGIGGGAILSTSTAGNSATVTVINSTITGNTANANANGMVGGGIYFANGALKLFNSTVVGNRAGIAGGNIHQATVANTSLTMRNSIVSGGLIDAAGPAATDIDIFQPGGASIASAGYNIVTNRSAATGYALTDAANGTNPVLGALSANGGPTQTLLPLATSPATGLVPLASCLDDAGAALTRDQRGVPRQTAGAATCDAGATEASRLSISTTLPNGILGSAYSQSLVATGGLPPFVFSLASGTLPAGLTLTGNAIAGTPAALGASTFSVGVSDQTGASTTRAYTVVIQSAPAITTLSLPDGTVGSAYSATVSATGSPAPTFAGTGLPPGLALSAGGVIAGTPTLAGTYSAVTVTASNGVGVDATRVYSIAIAPSIFALNVNLAGTGVGSVTAPGLSCAGTICSGSFAAGTMVTLTTTPDANSIFAGWSGSCTGTAVCTVTMDASKSATATFDLLPTVLTAVRSRKIHGTEGPFDIVVDATVDVAGAVSVEPRAIGAGHTLVFTFNRAITSAGSVTASAGSASAVSVGNDVVVTLTGVADNTRATITLTNVNLSGLTFAASLGFLVGDVNNTRSVNSSDISGVKARSGQTTTALNFSFDVNASGAVNSSDISAVKARSGLTLAP